MKFNFRPYRQGDERAINQLYFEVTGRRRTVEQFRWQWLQAPGGAGEIWLIEAVGDNGDAKLVGHHGIMPVRFSCGDVDFLFGKTENTMVLPEYRDKIIYPRFEKRFQDAYQSRFHALFSTFGPDAAVRLRLALGYELKSEWKFEKLATSSSSATYLLRYFLRRKIQTLSSKQLANAVSERPSLISAKFGAAGFYSDEEAASLSFFDSFWRCARLGFGVTPSRDKIDLKWRFWTNPYKSHLTSLLEQDGVYCGYAIISINAANPLEALLEDYAVIEPRTELVDALLEQLLGRLKAVGVKWLNVNTTDDSTLLNQSRLFRRRKMWIWRLLQRMGKKDSRKMPRKITPSGIAAGLVGCPWEVSGIIFEGRP